jgi:hypothetical protein
LFRSEKKFRTKQELEGYSTVDNIFDLHSFFKLIKLKKKKLFAALADFEKAFDTLWRDALWSFDTVWRDALWSKLLINNINGKMYNIICNMYQNIKSRIVYNGKVSNYFDCNNGVRQIENLQPFLFSLYLNDLEQFLDENNAIGLISLTEDLEQELDTYLKLFIVIERKLFGFKESSLFL